MLNKKLKSLHFFHVMTLASRCKKDSFVVMHSRSYKSAYEYGIFQQFDKNRKLRYFEHLSSPITKNVGSFITFVISSV